MNDADSLVNDGREIPSTIMTNMTEETRQVSPSPLLVLPQELLVRISSFLKTSELGTLRCTCKEIETRLFSDFASTFFSKRQFMIEHVSLQALVGIANHPGLAPYLSHVIIDAHVLLAQTFNYIEMLYSEHGLVDRDTFIYSGMARDMLVEAFRKLPNLRSVGIRDYSARGRVRDGDDALWRSWGWSSYPGEPKTTTSRPSPLLPLLLSSLAAAGSRPSRLEVFLHKTMKLAPTAFMVPDAGPTSPICSLLSNLEAVLLHISFKSSDFTRSSDYTTLMGVYPLKKFLLQMPNVQFLRLNFNPGEEEDVDEFLQWFGSCDHPPNATLPFLQLPPLQLPHLVCLDLGKTIVDIDTLTLVLTRFPLSSINLWEVVLRREQSEDRDLWKIALQTLSSQLSPTSCIRDMSIGRARQVSGKALHLAVTKTIRFVPEATKDEDKEKAMHFEKIKFDARYTAVTIKQWLMAMSRCTFDPHSYISSTRPFQRSYPDSSEEESDGDREEIDEGVDEDEEEDG